MTYKGTKPGGLRRFPPKIFCFNIWTLPRQNLLTVPSPLYWALQKTSQNYQSNPKPKCSGWDTKNADRLGHRDIENADKMLGHRDTKYADRLGHRDIKNVEKISFGFLRLENQVYWFLFSTNFPNFVPIFHSFFCCIIFSKEHIFILCIVKSPIEACFLFFLLNNCWRQV